jgi:hypothetical protein
MPGIGLRKLWKLQAIIEGGLGSPVPDRRAVPPCGRGSHGPEFRSFRSNVSRAAGLLLGIRSTTDVQLVHLVLEGCSFQSEALCGSTLAGYSPGGGSQGLDDDLPLSLFKS